MGTYLGLTPYLHYDDVEAMVEWSARVFGFQEQGRLRRDGTVGEAQVLAGELPLWFNNAEDRVIMVWVDDVDAHYERVTAAGVEAEPPQERDYWGNVRAYWVDDPEGNRWSFLERIAAE